MKKLIFNFIYSINYIIPKNSTYFIFVSSPDLTDNSFAFFKYLVEENSNNQYIFLVNNIENKKLYYKMIKENTNINLTLINKIKIISKKSILGIYYYMRSKYIFFTHGFYTGINIPKNQVRINLWHGMPLKAIGYLNKFDSNDIVPKSSYVIATSKFYKNIMSKVFNIDKSKVIITHQPRCKFLFENSDSLLKLNIKKEEYNKIIFWAPTYRKSKNNKIDDGKYKGFLPMLSEENLTVLNTYLKKINSFLIIKLHPMDILNNFRFKEYSNINILKNEILLRKGIQLYSILSDVDILLTDFSSIYIDFLLLNRPIIFMIDDLDEYTKNRDFIVKNPLDYMPGEKVNNFNELLEVFDKIVVNKKDDFLKDRLKLLKLFYDDNLLKDKDIILLEMLKNKKI